MSLFCVYTCIYVCCFYWFNFTWNNIEFRSIVHTIFEEQSEWMNERREAEKDRNENFWTFSQINESKYSILIGIYKIRIRNMWKNMGWSNRIESDRTRHHICILVFFFFGRDELVRLNDSTIDDWPKLLLVCLNFKLIWPETETFYNLYIYVPITPVVQCWTHFIFALYWPGKETKSFLKLVRF